MEALKEKHPPAADIEDECLLHGPLDYILPNIFDLIDEQMIYNAAMKTKGSAGSSGMDAEIYKRILCSKNFSIEGKLLREEIAALTRNLLKSSYHPSLMESYTSCRLIPLDKNPGIRPNRSRRCFEKKNWQNHIRLLEGVDQAGSRSPAGLRWSLCGCRGRHTLHGPDFL